VIRARRILVPVDFSKDSLGALAYAREFAQSLQGELLVLYVIEPIYYAAPDMYAASTNMAMLIDEQRRIAKEQLARLSKDLTKRGQRHKVLTETGAPAQCILDAAKRLRADMIIMATHGRTGLAHVFMGSVAERVVRSANCPVLTVHRGVRPRVAGARRRSTPARRPRRS